MKWASFEYRGQTGAGLVEDQQIYPIYGVKLETLLVDLAAAAERARLERPLGLGDIKLRQPILRPGKILGIGLNYAAHAAESVSFVQNKAPDVQKWFNKQSTAANGPYDPVHLPRVSEQLDYEAELVVIIGRSGRHVPERDAMHMVAGYACGCDYSVRDWQKASPTMIMGKGFDTHAPFGPFLVTPDEAGPVEDLTLTSRVNGEVRQSAKAGEMSFSIAQQIAHLTAAFTLEPGDVIFTGTPAGVGAGHTPPKWLNAGDRVRVDITGLGAIENEIIPEPSPVPQ